MRQTFGLNSRSRQLLRHTCPIRCSYQLFLRQLAARRNPANLQLWLNYFEKESCLILSKCIMGAALRRLLSTQTLLAEETLIAEPDQLNVVYLVQLRIICRESALVWAVSMFCKSLLWFCGQIVYLTCSLFFFPYTVLLSCTAVFCKVPL